MTPYRRPLPVLVLALLAAAGCGRTPDTQPAGPGTEPAAPGGFERGPHRGRLLRDGDFALELQVFEAGVPPEFHVYLFRGGQPLPPDAATVSVELTRLDGERNGYAFAPQGDHLRGDGVVAEPHSFAVHVVAQEGGRTHRWAFDSFEGRTTIPAAIAAAAGIRTEVAGPARIADTVRLNGRVAFSAERVRSVGARFPGAVRRVLVTVGDRVQAGQALAVLESNESLTDYTLVAPIAGTVVERHANPGENAPAGLLFVVADDRRLWAELAVFPRDVARVRAGQRVLLRSVDGGVEGEGRITRVLPPERDARDAAAVTAAVAIARVEVDNADGRWTPGLFIDGEVEIATHATALAVKRSALQGFRDFQVVFAQVGDTYEVRMLELGRQDDTWVEVTGGLKPGTAYVTQNSYLIKADIGKSGASHDH